MPGSPKHARAAFEWVARRRREESLAPVGRITRAIGASSVSAVGGLGRDVARAFPGHQSTGSTPSTITGVAGTPSAGSSSTSATNGTPSTLTPPTSPPVRTTNPPVVVSGAG